MCQNWPLQSVCQDATGESPESPASPAQVMEANPEPNQLLALQVKFKDLEKDRIFQSVPPTQDG